MHIHKTIKAKEYRLDTKLGEAVGRNVEVRLTQDGVIRDNFNQYKHEHLLGSDEVDKVMRVAAETFIKENYHRVLKGEHQLIADEVSGIRLVLGLSVTELAEAVGLTKGTMSRILHGQLSMKRPESILLMERLIQEVTEPGTWNKAVKGTGRRRRKADRLRGTAA